MVAIDIAKHVPRYCRDFRHAYNIKQYSSRINSPHMILRYLTPRQAEVSVSGRGTSQDQRDVPEDAEHGNVVGDSVGPSRSGLENSHPPLIRVT